MRREPSIRVDPIACDGHGLCAELFPERISLDDWGFPIVDPAPVPAALDQHARRAIKLCPTRALAWGTPARLPEREQARHEPRLG